MKTSHAGTGRRTSSVRSLIDANHTMKQLAEIVCKVLGFGGRLGFDTSKPDGTPHELMDPNCLLEMGWAPTVCLSGNLIDAYAAFQVDEP